MLNLTCAFFSVSGGDGDGTVVTAAAAVVVSWQAVAIVADGGSKLSLFLMVNFGIQKFFGINIIYLQGVFFGFFP